MLDWGLFQFFIRKVHRKLAQFLYIITRWDNEIEDYLTSFIKEEMNVQDKSVATTSGALMARLKSSTILKYLVFFA